MSLGVNRSSGSGPSGAGRYTGVGSSGSGESIDKNGRVKQTFEVEEAQKSISSVSNPGHAEETAKVSKSAETPPAKEGEAPVKESFVRSLNPRDIVDLLVKILKQPTEQNAQIITAMIEHGLPANEQTFDVIERLLKGKTDSRSIESAVVSYSKGLDKSPKSVDILRAFLSKGGQLPEDLAQLQKSLQKFQAFIKGAGADLLAKGLNVGLQSVLSELDDYLKDWTGTKTEDQLLSIQSLNPGGLFEDLKVLHGFLRGLKSRLGETSGNFEELTELQTRLSKVLNQFTSQAILSKESDYAPHHLEDFAFWQIPNPYMPASSTIDILIKKSKKDGKRQIDPEKTQVILKFETESLGKVTFNILVNGRQVSVTTHADNQGNSNLFYEMNKEFQERFESLDYQLVGFHVSEKKVNIKQFLVPVVNLNSMTRISTEI